MAMHYLTCCFVLILATPARNSRIAGVAALRAVLPKAAMTTVAFNRDDSQTPVDANKSGQSMFKQIVPDTPGSDRYGSTHVSAATRILGKLDDDGKLDEHERDERGDEEFAAIWSDISVQSPINFNIAHALDKYAASCNRDVHFFAPEDCHIFEDHSACLQQRTNVTWLASYPGSGNTWTRVLLETATGLYTGSVYHDPVLMQAGMKGEGITDPSQVLVVKRHYFQSQTHTGRAIVLVRAPLNAALSFINIHAAAEEGNNIHSAETQRRTLKRRFAMQRDGFIHNWGSYMTFWLQNNDPKVFVRYEDLVNDTRATLTDQILPFLGIRPSELGEKMDCALQPQAETPEMRRNHSFNFSFEAEDYAAVKSILGDIPSQFGYHY